MKKKRSIRPLGTILLDLEVLIDELMDDQELQWGDLISLVHSHLVVHRQDAKEVYLDNTNPILYYGPKENK